MLQTMTGESPRAGLHVQPRLRQRLLRALGSAAHAALGPTQADQQRQDVVRRALVAAVIIGILPIQQMRIPGWPAVVIGCVVALCYDVLLAYLVVRKERYFVARVLGMVFDAIILMAASLYVFREMGMANSGSDIWMVFLVYIVIGGFTLAPAGSVLYTALWVGWFALGTYLYFPADSQFQDQLPIRLVFFAALGFIALGMAMELEKRRGLLERQNRQTLGMLAKLVEARDTDAGAHLHRIQHFSRALALFLGLSQREAQEVAYASMIHDVGKAHVPDAVLKKAGPLSEQEWGVMQRHTVWGDRLLADNSDFDLARQVARWHHERWDGGGYPDGLRGEEIPLAARIAAVADVYDALISERPYKGAWSEEAAVRELERTAGTHLDPEIVAAFVELWSGGVISAIGEQMQEDDPEEHFQLDRAA